MVELVVRFGWVVFPLGFSAKAMLKIMDRVSDAFNMKVVGIGGMLTSVQDLH